MVVVKTDSGYSPNPGHAGTRTVVSVVCPLSSATLIKPPEQSEFRNGEVYGGLEGVLSSDFAPIAVAPGLFNNFGFFESQTHFGEKQFNEERLSGNLLSREPG